MSLIRGISCSYKSMIPRLTPIAKAWVRSLVPSLARILRTWLFTVSSVSDSRAAINRLSGAYKTAWVARRIPSLFIKLRSVLGWTLRMAPAPLGPLITQPVLSSTRRTCWRCISSSESVGLRLGHGCPVLFSCRMSSIGMEIRSEFENRAASGL